MPRSGRILPGGLVYHVLNRGVARLPLFEKLADYAAFERVIGEALDRLPMRIVTYTLMPNHWHFILWPEHDGDLSAFCRWMTHTHSMRWHAHYHTSGTGHIYQGRFRAFPVETDDYFYTVCRYVERNALRAQLVDRPEDWRWSGLWRRNHRDEQPRRLLSKWPLPLPRNWLTLGPSTPNRTGTRSHSSFGAARFTAWLRAVAPTDGRPIRYQFQLAPARATTKKRALT